MRILVVRLGAMGDVIHTLPAAASLKESFTGAEVTWVVEPRWAPLLEGNPYVDEVAPFDRRQWASVRAAFGALRKRSFDLAVDFQGLIKSGVVARASGARRVAGYDATGVRERAAAWFYSERYRVNGVHVVDRHLGLVAACGGRAQKVVFPIPAGKAEGDLGNGKFALACPFAGWAAKEWPIERYGQLGKILRERFGVRLVLNGHAAVEAALRRVEGVTVQISSIAGLVDATRRASAVIGVDSGPLHLAAALGKRGVAIFGPTDPARNGPYGGTIRVLRKTGAVTTYKRNLEGDGSMAGITAEMVADGLEGCF